MNTDSTRSRFPLFDEIDRGLNRLVNEVLQSESRKNDSPPVVVYELDDRFVVECDLPGVALEDIELKVNDGILEISGERRNVVTDGSKVTLNERRFGSFSRKLKLSKDIQIDQIDAVSGNGVLKVSIPKSETVMPRQIRIRKSDEPSQPC